MQPDIGLAILLSCLCLNEFISVRCLQLAYGLTGGLLAVGQHAVIGLGQVNDPCVTYLGLEVQEHKRVRAVTMGETVAGDGRKVHREPLYRIGGQVVVHILLKALLDSALMLGHQTVLYDVAPAAQQFLPEEGESRSGQESVFGGTVELDYEENLIVIVGIDYGE